MPHLWTECVIGENIANWGPIFAIRLYLENAKDLTITTLGLDNNTISAVFHDLCRWRMPHRPSKILIVERLQSLSVTACSEMVDFAAEGLSFPALRSVSIQRIGHVFPTSILGACPNVELVELSFDGAYTLHDLVADGSHFPGSKLSKLTLIWLGNPQLEAVVDYFSGLTQLHSLWIGAWGAEVNEDSFYNLLGALVAPNEELEMLHLIGIIQPHTDYARD